MMNKKPPIYLDYNATAPMLPVVQEAMAKNLGLIGNPSSIHSYGRNVRVMIEKAREKVAGLINSDPVSVTFTSGATEANNMVLFGTDAERIIVASTEHPAIIETVKELSNVTILPVKSNGLIDLNVLEKELQASDKSTLVSIMWVNNETGVIQPMAEIAALVKKYNAKLHTDAVQAAGRLPIDMRGLGIDYMSLSAHKIGGPSGIGALVYGATTPLNKIIFGGGQERGRRAGTENVLGIIGFGVAAEYAAQNISRYDTLGEWRDLLEKKMMEAAPKAIFVGHGAPRVGNTLQVILPHLPSETQLITLDLNGIAVSSGSACSSGKVCPSHVLVAMGFDKDLSKRALRISMGPATTLPELETFLRAWVAISQRSGLG